MVVSDNLGAIIAGFFKPVDLLNGLISEVFNTDGDSKNLKVCGTGNIFWFTHATFIQIGQGAIPASSTDFEIQSAFGVSPEKDPQTNATPVYVSGIGKVTTAYGINSTGSGSITEVIFTGNFRDSVGATVGQLLLMRNTFGAVNFGVGQTISLDYEVFI